MSSGIGGKIVFLKFRIGHPIGNARKAKIFKDTNKYPNSLLILLSRLRLYRIIEFGKTKNRANEAQFLRRKIFKK